MSAKWVHFDPCISPRTYPIVIYDVKKTNLWCPLFVYFPLLQNWVDYECLFINGLWLCEYIFDLLECLMWVFYIVLSQRNAYTDVTEREIVCVCVCVWVCVCVCVCSCSSVSGLLPTCCRASGRHFVMGHPELDYSHTLFFSTVFSLLSFPPTPTWALHTTDEVPSALPTSVWPGGFTEYRAPMDSDLGWSFPPFLILSIQFIVSCFKCVKLDLMYPVTSSFSMATCDFQMTLEGGSGKAMINTDLRPIVVTSENIEILKWN